MEIRAAILWKAGEPLSVEAAELDPPGPGEVLVELKAAGVCHSDLHPARGDWPARTPLVLGHEGAGIIREIGPGVRKLQPGDPVVFSWMPVCGECASCRAGRPVLCDRLDQTTFRNKLPSGETRLHARGQNVNHFISTACFADYAVVNEAGAIAVPDDIPFDVLAMLGCAVVTGLGAATSAADVRPGDRVVVIGAGGVGLNVVQGCRLARCEQIVAVDVRDEPLRLAAEFGATHTLRFCDALHGAIRELTGGRGADVAFDTVGSPQTLSEALKLIRKGGTVVVTGLARTDSIGNVPLFPFVMQEKRLIGSVYGSGQPAADIPRLAALYQDGKLKLRELIARSYTLDEVNEALAALADGAGARGIIRW
jgi:S-(hydroxymethyl)glutathione dehydrogenase/alcohol dehydrogenase